MNLPERVEAALAKPEADLTPADLRLLIAQRTNLEDAVPRAIEVLDQSPLIEAQYYPGDLLKALLELPSGYWTADQESWAQVHAILAKLDRTLEGITEPRAQFMKVAS